jgi:hypothetical protein
MKEAKPDRFMVDRIGTPDPSDAQYYVLDVVYDFEARVLLRRLVRNYRRVHRNLAADELETYLENTQGAHAAMVEARNPQRQKKAKSRDLRRR